MCVDHLASKRDDERDAAEDLVFFLGGVFGECGHPALDLVEVFVERGIGEAAAAAGGFVFG